MVVGSGAVGSGVVGSGVDGSGVVGSLLLLVDPAATKTNPFPTASAGVDGLSELLSDPETE